MRNGEMVLVKCMLRRGAFSGERVFRLSMIGGPGEYVGIAPVGDCMDENHERLDRDQPAAGAEIEGLIEAYLITNGGNEARIELPDGEAIKVAVNQVPFQIERGESSKYVPIGS